MPVSDAGNFMVGEISPEMFNETQGHKFGVVIWYDDKEIAKEAAKAVMDAHWDK